MNIIIDLKKNYSPYFIAFIKARGLKNGDVCKDMNILTGLLVNMKNSEKRLDLTNILLTQKSRKRCF